ncbi:MAG: aldehyde ferredoxin oxidoreductase family protein [Zestosphaera sp.]
MVYSVNGRILHVDLTNDKVWVEKYGNDLLELFIGSRGIQARLYWDLVSPEAKAFSSGNVLFVGSGTFTGTPLPSSGRTTVTFKSPATNMYFKASVGGDFGLKLKLNGYDVVAIHGVSEKPVYVYIENDHVDIIPADKYWGLDVRTAHIELIRKHGLDADTLLIGPAGENLVKYASVNCSVYNVAARGGGGAVLGYKKLKGIVASKGDRSVILYNPKKFYEKSLKVSLNIMNDAALVATAKFGTASATMGLDRTSTLPCYNFRRSFWENAYRNAGEYYVEAGYLIGRAGCAQCIVSCHRHTATSKYGGVDTVGPEYETSNALGGNLGNSDTDALIKMNDLANIYGLDTISLGGVIGWVMESYERGYLKDLKEELGVEPLWGNVDAIIKLIEDITFRRGTGDLLAEGLAIACEKVGTETCKWAIQSRGLEHSRVETRIARAYALAFALNPRGPDHLHTETFAEFGFTEEARRLIKRLTGSEENAGIGKDSGRPEIVVWHEDIYAVTDSVGLCAFIDTAGFAVDEVMLSELFEDATGIASTPEKIMKSGERIVTLERMIQVREGRSRKDDTLPWRILNEEIITREGKRYVFTEETLNSMLDKYFKLRGWNVEKGIPTPEKLKELKLEFAIEEALRRV